MARYEFKLPDVGEGIAEAEIVAWHVQPGDVIEEDSPLADVMTDKATVEVSAPVAGKVLELAGNVGSFAAVGSVLVVLDVVASGDSRERTSAVRGASEAAASPPAPSGREHPTVPPKPVAPQPDPKAPTSSQIALAQIAASPAVRRQALERGIRIELVTGTGPNGRVTLEDLDGFDRAVTVAPKQPVLLKERKEIPVIGLRRRIAERMSEAKRRIPHFSYIDEIDVTELERLRSELNARYPDSPKLSVLPFLVRALVNTAHRYPQINATFDDEAGVVTRHSALHVGIATQTSNGLVVPVLRHAESLDLWATALAISALSGAARNGTAKREDLSGSTITITSLGPIGGLATTPVINRPEVAILGPNRIIERPVVRDGQVVIRKMMNLSSSFDHRVVDGWDAAEFIQALKRILETPALLFLDQP